MELVQLGALGDQLATTALVREIKRQMPDENVRVFEPSRMDIWKFNPYLGIGNKDNGKRIKLRQLPSKRIVDWYADCIADATGDLIQIQDDTPELFLTEEEKATNFGLDLTGNSIAIDPCAGWGTRQWPHENWLLLSRKLLSAGWKVYELGAERRRTKPPLPSSSDLFGTMKLRETAVFLSQVKLYAGNDSGLMHLAAAMGTPQVIAFGLVPAKLRAYKTTHGISGSECSKLCNWARCRKESFCMNDITVDMMFAKITEVGNG